MAFTPKQQAFIREYLVDLNGTQAAIRAGYSPRTANEQAAELLAKPSIRDAVTSGKEKLVETTEITKLWVIQEAIATYKQAKELNQPAAARGNLELIARLHGYIIEKKDVRVRSIKDLADEELAAIEADYKRELEREKADRRGTTH
jgi:hypothetical protein